MRTLGIKKLKYVPLKDELVWTGKEEEEENLTKLYFSIVFRIPRKNQNICSRTLLDLSLQMLESSC